MKSTAMNDFPMIEMEELNRSITNRDSFQDIFSVVDIAYDITIDKYGRSEERNVPMRLQALLMVLVIDGVADIFIDYMSYKISKGWFVMIMPTHTILINQVSPDFKGKMIMANKDFLEDCNPSNKVPSMIHYMQLKKNPCTSLQPEEAVHLENYIELLRQKIRLRTHMFQKEVIVNSFIGYMLEVANVMMGKNNEVSMPILSRKELLFEQFLQLLFEHCKLEHEVTFYSEKLCITPQYLSLILKKQSGRSANKWIDDMLLVEAKVLLKAPGATIQQIADELHFSDQSSFGKFFKKHMGVSPMEYRKSV